MKKALYIVIPLTIITIVAVFMFSNRNEKENPVLKEQTTGQSSTQSASTVEQSSIGPEEVTGNENEDTAKAQESTVEAPDELEILTSLSVDLDGDGNEEKVEIGRRAVNQSNVAAEYEGWLKIKGKDGVKALPFVRKTGDLTSVYNDILFEDLDSDGIKDIFITISDVGNPFTINYFFMYNYKTGRKFSYPEDSLDVNPADFASNFLFSYKGKGMLSIVNIKYDFEGKIDLNDNANFSDSEDINKLYEKSWVDPVPVEIDEDSRVSIVKNDSQSALIKLPLPVFGQATVDLIGEVDMYLKVDNNFKPILLKFEVIDYNRNEKVKAGEVKL